MNIADLEGFAGGMVGRYRRTLRGRGDIRGSSGLSAGDLAQLDALYGAPPAPGQLAVAN